MSVIRQEKKNRFKKSGKTRGRNVSKLRVLGICVKVCLGLCLYCLLVLSFVFVYDAITQCDCFRAEEIRVTGAGRLSEKEVLEAAGLERGVNVLSVNLSLARKRLEAEPWIDSASVRREFPPGLLISIKEHEPMAVLDVGRLFLVNGSGEIFKEAGPSEIRGIPVVSGLDYSRLEKPQGGGTRVGSELFSLLKSLESAPPVFDVHRVHEVSVDREMGFTLEMNGPLKKVYLGYGNYESKMERVQKVLDHADARRNMPELESVDAHAPDRIVATPSARDSRAAEKEVQGEGEGRTRRRS